MVKINIQFEEPTEEWNQLIEIANTDKTILGYLLQREDVEVFLSKKITETSVPTKEQESQIEATPKVVEEKLEEDRKRKEEEDAFYAAAKAAFEECDCVVDVYEHIKKNATLKSKQQVKSWNRTEEFGVKLPHGKPKIQLTDEDLKVRIPAAFCAQLAHRSETDNLKKRNLREADEKAMIKGLITKVGDRRKRLFGGSLPTNYQNKYLEEATEIIINFMDPSQNPQRGEEDDQQVFVHPDGSYNITKNWVRTLTKEIYGLSLLSQKAIDNTDCQGDEKEDNLCLCRLGEWLVGKIAAKDMNLFIAQHQPR
jgi:hypothetical protein